MLENEVLPTLTRVSAMIFPESVSSKTYEAKAMPVPAVEKVSSWLFIEISPPPLTFFRKYPGTAVLSLKSS